MDRRCENCKFWADLLEASGSAKEWGRCDLGESRYGQPIYPTSMAYAYTEQGDRAELKTHRDFGCLQWKKD